MQHYSWCGFQVCSTQIKRYLWAFLSFAMPLYSGSVHSWLVYHSLMWCRTCCVWASAQTVQSISASMLSFVPLPLPFTCNTNDSASGTMTTQLGLTNSSTSKGYNFELLHCLCSFPYVLEANRSFDLNNMPKIECQYVFAYFDRPICSFTKCLWGQTKQSHVYQMSKALRWVCYLRQNLSG